MQTHTPRWPSGSESRVAICIDEGIVNVGVEAIERRIMDYIELVCVQTHCLTKMALWQGVWHDLWHWMTHCRQRSGNNREKNELGKFVYVGVCEREACI